MVRPRLVIHISSSSGPNLTRFALSFAQHAGGDVLWFTFIPEGTRRWFESFAASCDPSRAPSSPFRIVRPSTAPSLDVVEQIVDAIQRQHDGGDPTRSPDTEIDPASPTSSAIAEIISGALHPAAIILDVHHLPILTKACRTDRLDFARRHHLRPASSDALVRQVELRVRALLSRTRDVGLHMLVATPRVEPPENARSASALDAALLAGIDAEADLWIEVGEAPPLDGRFVLSVRRAGRFDTLEGWAHGAASWDDLLAQVGWGSSWNERLNHTCPRIGEDVPLNQDSEEGISEIECSGFAARILNTRSRLSLPPSPDLAENPKVWADATQDEFVRWAEERGWQTERSTLDEDRREHWDVALSRGKGRNKERYRVDVKARSRLRRSDATPQDAWHWVELRGVVDDGWLFGGASDLIAFQTVDSFLLVARAELAAHVRHHVDPDALVARRADAVYRVYHRRDDPVIKRATGPDRGVLTLIPTERLRRLAWDGKAPLNQWSDTVPRSEQVRRPAPAARTDGTASSPARRIRRPGRSGARPDRPSR